jgi:hypothetical protein
MHILRRFTDRVKVIWNEDIHYWVWWHTIGKWRIGKNIREGKCLKCGKLIGSDDSHCDCIYI